MARRRFFVDSIHDGRAELSGEDALHLTRVLRAEIGQRFEISDNRGVYLAEIRDLRKDRVSFEIIQTLEARGPALRVTLAVSLIKFDRFEWLLEKATELGVEAILPVSAERSEKGLLEAARKRVQRWRRIVRESAQQSRRARLPVILDPCRLDAGIAGEFACRYLLDEGSGATPILQALPPAAGSVCLLVGPEGGWREEERARFAAEGWTPVSLGPHILRTETAAIAGLAVLIAAVQPAP